MNLIKKAKKGFTLVELVVVIAVIAILAAVSIVSYVSITKKANQSADNQLITEVNTSLAGLDATKKPKTMYEAVHAIEEDGLRVDKLQERTKGWHYAYSLEKNRFIIVDDAGKTVAGPEGFGDVEPSKLWMFADDTSDITETYAYYLRGKQTISEPVEIKTSFDVGENTISSLTYKNPTSDKEVLVRTNGGTFTVNAPEGTVKHHGEATTLKIEQIKTSSYHENGTVSFAEISKGRIVLEKGSDVSHIHVNKKNDTSFDEVIIAKDQQVEMPNLSRDDVTIGASGTLVVALQEGTGDVSTSDLDYVWLTKQGIYEQIKVSDSSTSAGDVWADSSTVSEETQEAAQQIANNYISDSVRPEWSSSDANRDLSDITNASAVAEAVAKEEAGSSWDTMTEEQKDAAVAAQESVVVNPTQAVEKPADKEDVQTGATLFGGGSGSKLDPYLVYDFDTMQNISTLYDEGYYYYAVNLSKTDNGKIDCRNDWTSVYLNGSFEGKGVEFTNVNQRLFRTVGKFDTTATERIYLKNFDVTFNVHSPQGASLIGNLYCQDTEFRNVNIHGYLEGGANSAAYYCYGCMNGGTATKMFVNFYDCDVDATLVSTSGNLGVFSGMCFGGTGDKKTTIFADDECEWSGQAYLKSTNKLYLLCGVNANSYLDNISDNIQITENVFANLATITPTKSENVYTLQKQSGADYVVIYVNGQFTENTSNGTQIPGANGITVTLGSFTLSWSDIEDGVVLGEISSVTFNAGRDLSYSIKNGNLTFSAGGRDNNTTGTISIRACQYNDNSRMIASSGELVIAEKTAYNGTWGIK